MHSPQALHTACTQNMPKIRTEEKRNYKMEIDDKCNDPPELFYIYINDKLKLKHSFINISHKHVDITHLSHSLSYKYSKPMI